MAGTGILTVLKKTSRLAAAIEKEQVRNVKKILIKIERTAKKKATGRPGPKVRTGRLRSSISHRMDSSKLPKGEVGALGADAHYAVYLEFGTSKMQPYPFLRPAVKDNEREIINIVREASQKVVGKFISVETIRIGA